MLYFKLHVHTTAINTSILYTRRKRGERYNSTIVERYINIVKINLFVLIMILIQNVLTMTSTLLAYMLCPIYRMRGGGGCTHISHASADTHRAVNH